MDKYLVEIPPKPPPLSATDALIIHGKVEKENNGNGEKPNKTSNSNCNNKSNKVKFNMTQNEVWEIEGVPSIEKENLWWTKYELQRNIKKPKESQQKQHQQTQTMSETKKVESEELSIYTKRFYSLLDQTNFSAAQKAELIANHEAQKVELRADIETVIAEQAKLEVKQKEEREAEIKAD